MRGQAEGLCGDARIKGLPVSGKRGAERAVALVAGALLDHGQHDQRRCAVGGLLVVGKTEHAVVGQLVLLSLVGHNDVARDLRILPARRKGGSFNDLTNLVLGHRLLGELADASAGFDTFQCFHENIFLLEYV